MAGLAAQKEVGLLILGAGWTSTFLIPQLRSKGIAYAATTTTGRDGTIKFIFDPDSTDLTPYQGLPRAKTVLITFPLKGKGQSRRLTEMYWKTHAPHQTNWIQLGSTGIFQGSGWNDRHSAYDESNARAIAEDELMECDGAILNLAGLYGGTRQPQNWLSRVFKKKEDIKVKGALHLVHGEDVAAAIIAVHYKFYARERWIVTDRHVYDWWDLVDAWGGEKEDEAPYRRWVQECMKEEGVRALPRDTDSLGRLVDSTDFWNMMGILPKQRLSR